jgi:transcriptional regulator of acetoin/glycerol metabolism
LEQEESMEDEHPSVSKERPPLAPVVELSPEAARIKRALDRAAGNRERAAKILGFSRITLWRRMRELGIEP